MLQPFIHPLCTLLYLQAPPHTKRPICSDWSALSGLSRYYPPCYICYIYLLKITCVFPGFPWKINLNKDWNFKRKTNFLCDRQSWQYLTCSRVFTGLTFHLKVATGDRHVNSVSSEWQHLPGQLSWRDTWDREQQWNITAEQKATHWYGCLCG